MPDQVESTKPSTSGKGSGDVQAPFSSWFEGDSPSQTKTHDLHAAQIAALEAKLMCRKGSMGTRFSQEPPRPTLEEYDVERKLSQFEGCF
jgi:hypothetical protein